MQYYQEEARQLAVTAAFDVIVVGGGPAGCAAAIAAARLGANTLLVEKDGYLGGATVSQYVMPVLSMNKMDFQGVWHEWMHELKAINGVGDLAVRNGRKVDGSVDCELVKYAWDRLLEKAGVRILHHTWVADVMKERQAVCGIIAETVAGRMAVAGKRVIDCTGDGLVSSMAGVKWDWGNGKGGAAMAMTKPFLLGNVHKPADFPSDEYMAKIDADFAKSMQAGEFTDPIITSGRITQYIKKWIRQHGARPEMLIGGPSRVLNVDPLDPWQLSEAERTARKQISEVKDYYLKYCPGCENAYFQSTSNHIGVRSSRRLHGIDRVTDAQALQLRKSPDSIARSSWHIDVWPSDSYTAGADISPPEWFEKIKGGDYFDIPFGCVVADGVDNLLMAGRCVSADHLAQSSLRIQQTCQSTGQAAGTIAALSLRENLPPRQLEPQIAVKQLEADRNSVIPFV